MAPPVTGSWKTEYQSCGGRLEVMMVRALGQAFVGDGVEHLGLFLGVGPEAEVIENQQVYGPGPLHQRLGPAGVEIVLKLGQELVGFGEEHLEAPAACLVSDSLGDEGLAYPRWTGEDQVLLLADEAAGSQIPDGRRRQLVGVEVEVVGGEGAVLSEPGQADALLEIVGFRVGDLVADHQVEELLVAQLAVLASWSLSWRLSAMPGSRSRRRLAAMVVW